MTIRFRREQGLSLIKHSSVRRFRLEKLAWLPSSQREVKPKIAVGKESNQRIHLDVPEPFSWRSEVAGPAFLIATFNAESRDPKIRVVRSIACGGSVESISTQTPTDPQSLPRRSDRRSFSNR